LADKINFQKLDLRAYETIIAIAIMLFLAVSTANLLLNEAVMNKFYQRLDLLRFNL